MNLFTFIRSIFQAIVFYALLVLGAPLGTDSTDSVPNNAESLNQTSQQNANKTVSPLQQKETRGARGVQFSLGSLIDQGRHQQNFEQQRIVRPSFSRLNSGHPEQQGISFGFGTLQKSYNTNNGADTTSGDDSNTDTD